MARLYTLPLAGEDQVFSIYGRRDLDGNGTLEDTHGGWDIRPPRAGGQVPPFDAQAPAAGTVDWAQTWDGHTKTGSQSYGNAARIRTAENVYIYAAHMTARQVSKGQTVAAGQVLGHYGAKTTGNSGGPHIHVEMRDGGTSSAKRACPGEFFGLANTKDVTYHRERMEAAVIGLLTCTKANYRWRTGPGTDEPLFTDKNNGALMYCRKGVIYRVYATATDAAGQLWCQITPPAGCITKGSAPALWVSAACGSYAPGSAGAMPGMPADSAPTGAGGTGAGTPTDEPGAGMAATAAGETGGGIPANPNDTADWDAAGNDFVVTASKGDREHLRRACAERQLPVHSA